MLLASYININDSAEMEHMERKFPVPTAVQNGLHDILLHPGVSADAYHGLHRLCFLKELPSVTILCAAEGTAARVALSAGSIPGVVYWPPVSFLSFPQVAARRSFSSFRVFWLWIEGITGLAAIPTGSQIFFFPCSPFLPPLLLLSNYQHTWCPCTLSRHHPPVFCFQAMLLFSISWSSCLLFSSHFSTPYISSSVWKLGNSWHTTVCFPAASTAAFQ